MTGRPRAFNGASLMLLVALRWRAKSLDLAEGYLADNWERVRRHGLAHGCRLHERPPRWEHLRTIREDDRFAELLEALGYGRLMQGAAQGRIMCRGALPIVEHGQADAKVTDPRRVVVLPDDLVPVRGSKAAKGPRKGKGRRRRSGDAPTEKRRLAVAQLPDAVHDGLHGPCHHQLATIDTCLVVHDGGSDRDWWHRTEVPPLVRVERVANGDGTYALWGVWRLRCEHADRANRHFEHRVELSGTTPCQHR